MTFYEILQLVPSATKAILAVERDEGGAGGLDWAWS